MQEPSTQERGGILSIMNVHDIAGYLRMSEAKVYRLANQGILPCFRCGKSWRFRRDLVDEWIINETRQTRQVPG
jgi:excisionase family DNA binding protein